jgi:DNA-binding transcriptional LysR family regulator
VADSVTEMDAEVADVGAALPGVLRIAVPQSFGLMHLTPAIDLFVKQHPEITIHIDFQIAILIL